MAGHVRRDEHARPDKHLRHNFINGRWLPALSGETRRNFNPSDTGDVIGDYAESSARDVSRAVGAALAARSAWRAAGPIERAGYVRTVERLLGEREAEVAAAISREQGKLLREAVAEVRRSRSILDFMAGEGRRLNGYTTPAEDPGTLAMVFRVPLGVVGLITPWNFPLAIPVWKVAPALVAGCCVVLKPSPLTPHSAALLVEAFSDAGLPPGVLNLVQGDSVAGQALVAEQQVVGISFTGSVPVGRAIQAAGADRLLRTQLELGGKNAVLVLADADLDAAADAIVVGAFSQAGQRCSATSRVIVDRRVKDDLLDRTAALARGLKVGPAFDPAADLGPLVSAERVTACLDAVAGARRDGARTAVDGSPGDKAEPADPALRNGHYVWPTILYDVRAESHLAQREVFGPVLAMITCADFDDGIRIANSVEYGMSAAVFTRDAGKMFESVERLEAGMLHVNRPGVGAYAHLPHIGTKQSQLGPPECSPQVFDFYTEWRSACINLTGGPSRR
jgi:acyl-CoA reductase-like NAD-dependent aldehyde dehydrogenase